ncbi:hypothetical protein PIIN_10951 [Serendipita indica DSM 11827]|uniref:F-box domain-containing protein n=1 Tax=Serendipita indica (strain DSM 11827) TaxID=1109443 RepID=G4U075_SERID|nr:hypothetical protein PIIN_10951 [Serendipita indica DSM 11827]
MDHHRRLCVAQLLPREILYLILEAVISLDPPRLLQAHLSREQTAGKPEWRSLPYICRSWYVPAQSRPSSLSRRLPTLATTDQASTSPNTGQCPLSAQHLPIIP